MVPRMRSTRACWNSSSGPASAVASSSRALANAPARMLAIAAANMRSARRDGSAVSATDRSRNAAGRGQPAAGLRLPGTSLELSRDLFIRPGRGLGTVPGPPVRIGQRVGHLGQRPVHLPPVGE